jgi:hypothetical protein
MAWENQYLPSVGLPEVSYFDARLGWEVNKNFQVVCNLVPYKAPYHQQFYLEDYTINPNEKWNPDYFYMKGRDWFTTGLYLAPGVWDGYQFTDSVTLNGNDTIYLAIKFDRTKCKIGRKIGWELVDITRSYYVWTSNTQITEFPFYKWLSEKLTQIYFAGWEPRWFWKGHPLIVASDSGQYRHNETDWYYITDDKIIDQSWEYDQTKVLAWDYIYNIDTWECAEVTSVYANKIKISWAWIMEIDKNQLESIKKNIKYVIFPKRQDTAVFSTDNGVVQYHWTWLEFVSWLPTTFNMLPAGAAYWKNLDISSMESYQDNLYMIDKKSWRLYFGNNGTQQLVIPYGNYIDIGYKYNWVSSFQWYLILLWPKHIWAAFQIPIQVSTSSTVMDIRFQELIKWIWTLWEFAFYSYYKWFQFIGNNSVLYSLNIQALYTGLLVPDIQVQSNYAVDHLKRVNNKDINIRLDVQEDIIRIYITNRLDASLQDINTKILIYDGYYRFRYHRIISGNLMGIDSNNMYYGLWHRRMGGNSDFRNPDEWPDSWEDIKQILWGMFGDQQPFQTKYITLMKVLNGQNCKYSENSSWLKVRLDFSWRSRTLTFARLTESMFVDTVMKRHMLWDQYQPADWTVILPGNWVPGWLQMNFQNEIDWFNMYDETMTTILTADYHEQMAKWGKMRYDIVEFADIIYFELVSKGWDKIDTGGMMLWYTNVDTDAERFEDILWLPI